MNDDKNGSSLSPSHLSRQDILRGIRAKVFRIEKEFTAAFEFINNYPRSVSFFGSSRFTEENDHYRKARELAKRIASELDCAIVTGGSGGIMEAANRGAFEAGKKSVGLNIRLPKAQPLNSYITDSIEFNFFFVRKTALSYAAEAYVFFPGGFGTMDEFFEILELISTRKIKKVPIILVGSHYWNRLNEFIKNTIFQEHRGVDENDMKLYTITDDNEKIIELIRAAS